MKYIKTIVLFLILAFASYYFYNMSPLNIYIFEEVKGPLTKTELPIKPEPTDYRVYEKGGASRVAILITQDNDNWLGIAHGFKSYGIPFTITKDIDRALKHKVIIAYPIITGGTFNAIEGNKLIKYVNDGGILIGTNVHGGRLKKLFGVARLAEGTEHTHIIYDKEHELTKEFLDLDAAKLKMGSTSKTETNVGTNSYINYDSEVIATYEDGSSAIIHKYHGKGEVYGFGIDIGELIMVGFNGREEDVSEKFINDYFPLIDSFLHLIFNIYKKSNEQAIRISPVPEGKSLAVLITHDVDYERSVYNSIDYAKYEKSEGIEATYFIQVKYMKDFYDIAFYNDENIKYINQLEDMGMEVANHSIAHSLSFNKFELGSGEEYYPEYKPFVMLDNVTKGGTILGELRVGKFLLDKFLKKQNVVSFRPGHLRYPFELPQALLSTGHKYSSNSSANNSLTHFPFQLNFDRGFESEIEIFEFPITIEDEAEPKLGDRLDEALEIADKLKEWEALFVVLIHPDILGHKLEFEKSFVKHVKDYSWFGTVSKYGDWWAARNEVEIDVSKVNSDELEIKIKSPKEIKGLSLNIPMGYKLKANDDEQVTLLSQQENKIVIERAFGEFAIRIVK